MIRFLENLVMSMLKVEVQKSSKSAMKPFAPFITDEEKGVTLQYFVRVVVVSDSSVLTVHGCRAA